MKQARERRGGEYECRRHEVLGGGGGGVRGHASQEIFEIGLFETPFPAFPGPTNRPGM